MDMAGLLWYKNKHKVCSCKLHSAYSTATEEELLQPTCVDDFMDDLCYLAFKKRVKELDQQQQTGAEDSQGGCQENQTHSEVW